jgi:cytochrome P450
MASFPDPQQFLAEAYQGEVLGEALFALLAEREDAAEGVARWRHLERLERHVKARLRGELEQRGLPTDEDPARRDTGHKLAMGLSALDWEKAREAIAQSVRGDVAELRESIDAAPAEIREVADFFLGHEQALLDFLEGRGALEGRDALEGSDAVESDGALASVATEAADPVARFLAETHAPPETPIPEGIQLIPQNPVYREDPAPLHRELQRRAPVHRDRQIGGLIVSGHDVVHRIAYDLELWVDPRKAREGDPVKMFASQLDPNQEPSMLFLDDPQHKRLRNLVSGAFTPRAVKELRPLIDRVATELLDAIEADGVTEFDLIDRLAAPLPAIAIARILGVDAKQQAQFKAWSVASSEAFFNPFADDETKRKGEEARLALDECFRGEIAKRRAEPAEDLIGKLVAAESEGDRMTEGELVTMCGLLLIAGNVTTTDLIGNGMCALLAHADEQAKLRARPDLIGNAVEEMLRFDPPVQVTGRIAPCDTEIDGVPIAEGESVSVLLAAANRDPAIYPDPDRFDIERADTHHHSFGGGAHLCLGAHLARAEAQAAIGQLVARFPKLRPAERPLAWKQTPGFRGLEEYWVRID